MVTEGLLTEGQKDQIWDELGDTTRLHRYYKAPSRTRPSSVISSALCCYASALLRRQRSCSAAYLSIFHRFVLL